MRKLCIYHANCTDGFGSAWVVRKAFKKGNVDFHQGVYGESPPDVTDREVIMVDFTYKNDVVLEMAKTAKSILIIDHHKSAEADLVFNQQDLAEGDYCPIDMIFDMNHSGAVLTWFHFFPDLEPPQLLQHIEDRDLWKFEMEGTRPILANLFSYSYNFKLWDDLMEENPMDLVSGGEAIERKHLKDVNKLIEVGKTRMSIAGHDVPVLNAPGFFSSDAGHIMGEGEKFAACYWFVPDGVVFSLRSSSEGGLDVSEIATQYGGGGHANAAGFKVETLNGLNLFDSDQNVSSDT